MKTRNVMKTLIGRSVLAGALVSLSLPAWAAGAPRTEWITMNAGETQVIDGLSADSKPALKVIENPHALIVNSDTPGKLTLVATEAGHADVEVRRADGTDLIYDVSVNAMRDASNPLKPVSMAEAEAPAALDPGAGAVVKTTSSTPSKHDDGAVDSRSSAAGAAAPATNFAPPVGAAAPVMGPVSAASVMPSQTANHIQPQAESYSTDPGIVASGETYSTDGVAASGGRNYLPADGISMMAGTSEVIDFPSRLRRVSVADTEVADVQVINPFQLNLIGHKPGFTTLAVWSRQGHYEERQIRVDPDGKQQVLLNCIVAELDRTRMENQGLNYSAALQNTGISLVGLPGAVATPYSQATNPNGTTTSAPTLNNGGSLTNLLLSQSMTYGLAAQGSGVLSQTFFQFLETHQLAKVLAQPRLLANSGEKAKFLSGGEIPIVIAQALNTSIVFKEFGTKVVFVPTVVGVNDIELLVQPEVSEPDYAHGVQLFGFNVPAFVTRRAETLVRLHDAQTLVIAGLILHQKTETVQKVPYLGDLPYAGALFRTTAYNNNESDLVMSVTPEIVRPLPNGSRVFEPTSRGPMSSEEIRTERLTVPSAARPRF